MSLSVRPVGISGVGLSVPPRVVTNHDLEGLVDTSDEWIRTRTGIIERRIAAPEVATSDLAIEAGRAALAHAGVAAADIDLIVVATMTPDMMFPATACIVQDGLKAGTAGAFDLQAGCSGFVYALNLASQYVAGGAANKALVIGADVFSRMLDWEDRSTCVLFGDGAGAVVVEPTEEGRGVLSCVLHADGAGADFLKMPAGGSRLPATADTVEQKLHFVCMDGPGLFRFAVRVVEEAAVECLAKAGLTLADVDLIIPHQANIRIIDACAKRMDVPTDRWVSNIDHYGNTSAATVPIALTECVESGRLTAGQLVLLIGFGAGLTYGATAIRW